MAGSMLVPAAEAAVGAPRTVLLEAHDSIVIVEGLDNGEQTTVEVLRDGVVVGSVTAAPNEFNVPNALEINHLDDPTLCWDNTTPAILPGDVVRVSGPGIAVPDTVEVIDFRIEEAVAGAAPGTIEIHGFNGESPRPAATTMDVQLRLAGGARFFAQETGGVAYDDIIPGDGAFTATIDGLTPAQVTEAVNNPLRLEAEYLRAANEIFATGPGGGPNPPEDPLCPPLSQHAVTSVSPNPINGSNAGAPVTVSGAAFDTESVAVTLSDTNPATDDVTGDGDLSGTTGNQTWTANFTGAQLDELQGTITASAVHTQNAGAGDIDAASLTFLRDTVPPAASGFTPNGGVHNNSALVELTAEPGSTIRYTRGDGTQAAPTASTGTVYSGPFTINNSETVKTLVTDAAGNSTAGQQLFTIAKAPGLPINLVGTGGAGQARLDWADGPFNDAAITGFRVEALTDGEAARFVDVAAGQHSHTFTGLTNGKTYRLRVRASNAAGDGEFAEVNAMPLGAASQPTGVRGTPAVNSARVSWTPPGNNGGTPVTGYKVHTYQGGGLVQTDTFGAAQTFGTIGGLLNGVDYTFRVVATNAVGDSAQSAPSPVVTPQQRPARVRRVVGTDGRPGGRTTATARWLAPRENTAELVRYEVRAYKVRRNGRLVLAAEAFSRVNRRVKTMSLRKGTYVFQVRAIGEAGSGRWSKRSGRVTAQ